ncbi:uncharacterized protein LOC144100077 isoform X2 [Amblyomma americanum]
MRARFVLLWFSIAAGLAASEDIPDNAVPGCYGEANATVSQEVSSSTTENTSAEPVTSPPPSSTTTVKSATDATTVQAPKNATTVQPVTNATTVQEATSTTTVKPATSTKTVKTTTTTKRPRRTRRLSCDKHGCCRRVLESDGLEYPITCKTYCNGYNYEIPDGTPCLKPPRKRSRSRGKNKKCREGICESGRCVSLNSKVTCRVPKQKHGSVYYYDDYNQNYYYPYYYENGYGYGY